MDGAGASGPYPAVAGSRRGARGTGARGAGGYEVQIAFDDGVTQDRQTNLNEGVRLVDAGLLSRLTFLTDPKYGQGLTEKEALAELERIRQEKGRAARLKRTRNRTGEAAQGAEKGEMYG